MTKVLDMVYCVECGNLVARANAEKVFRTGFYKTTIPLAHCKACAEKQTSEHVEMDVDEQQSLWAG
jgi:hypothetical protein